MSHAPWFKFYAADWLLSPSVRTMTAEQRGIYVQLLAEQWYSGNGLPSDDGVLCRLAACTPEEWGRSKDSVLTHFPIDECGRRLNKKLQALQADAALLSRERSLAGIRGNRKRWDSRNCDSQAIAVRSQTYRDSDSDSDKRIKPSAPTDPPLQKHSSSAFVRPTLEQVRSYCQLRRNGVDPEQWYDHYTSNGWKVGKTSMKDWQAAVRNWEKNDVNERRSERRPDDSHFASPKEAPSSCATNTCDGSGWWREKVNGVSVTRYCKCPVGIALRLKREKPDRESL